MTPPGLPQMSDSITSLRHRAKYEIGIEIVIRVFGDIANHDEACEMFSKERIAIDINGANRAQFHSRFRQENSFGAGEQIFTGIEIASRDIPFLEKA
jgi:hypothetical protein